ncbi:hypothetical protein MBIO_0505 [Mycoplasmopsis fermentans PG18]|uniref:Uncharacterized protein n=2 Tax=Mycoplasmopsis fermentans TaxID=2115 RepID=C4XF48_MYCFP|nr:hypothetical protein [Mycoplasmopsis fermentans]ADV34905.1 Hypothetical Protein MfeM64YM_0910 [Mycoplasmopsis fermentans M64]BAH69770.1 hypothetical protein MBIO_0505 [Mycoplasmopsis fermentans PG18]VEU64009.1 Uncharacterised protein [Mycoplasmopsis fermentans]VEU67375.1 Uncharacterised protein [Mesomycoplasma conjunctivae]
MFRTLKERFITLTVMFALASLMTIIAMALFGVSRIVFTTLGGVTSLGMSIAAFILAIIAFVFVLIIYLLYNRIMAKRTEDFSRFRHTKASQIFVLVALICYAVAAVTAILYFVMVAIVHNNNSSTISWETVRAFSIVFEIFFWIGIVIGWLFIILYYVFFCIIVDNITRYRRAQARKK